jgi:hypothetical protein
MFERFTDGGRGVLVLAQEEARLLGHGFIGTEHILLGLIREGTGVAAQVLEAMCISLDRVRERVADPMCVGLAAGTTESPPVTPRAKKVLELSLREALQLGHNYIGTEHMLLGLVREGEGVAVQVLLDLGADLQRVRQEVIQRLSGFGPVKIGNRAAVDGDLVEGSEIPVGAAALFGWDDATALLLSGPLLADARTERSEEDGIVYETCTYHPRLPPELSVSVAGAVVTRQAFERSTRRSMPDAELIDGVGDGATYSPAQQSLRVLVGSTVFVVGVRRHPHPRDATIQAALRAIAKMSPAQE